MNAVAPGALNTRLLDEVIAAGPDKVGADFYQSVAQAIAEGGVPLELGAELCAYLASAESDGITGKLLSAKWDPWKRLHDYKSRTARERHLRPAPHHPRGPGQELAARLTDDGPSASNAVRFAIVGCGLIGRKRLASLRPGQFSLAFDLDRPAPRTS